MNVAGNDKFELVCAVPVGTSNELIALVKSVLLEFGLKPSEIANCCCCTDVKPDISVGETVIKLAIGSYVKGS